MAATIRIARGANPATGRAITQVVTFRFNTIAAGMTVFTRSFRVTSPFQIGTVFVSQRPAAGTTASPTVNYTIVNAATRRPVTNTVRLTGTTARALRFTGLPAGTYALRIMNAGRAAVAVEGAIVI